MRLRARRQRYCRQLFDHLLTCEVVVGILGESQCDNRQPGHGHRADIRQLRNTGHFTLDRHGDRAFHVLRRLPGQLRNDAHLHILDIGKSLDWQVRQGMGAKPHQCRYEDEHKHALPQREDDESVDHGLSDTLALTSASSSKAPVVTTLSPPVNPSPT